MTKTADIISTNLLALRKKSRYTQRDVAIGIKISTPAYSKIEAGHTDVNISRLEQLAAFFNTSVSELVALNMKPCENPEMQDANVLRTKTIQLADIIELQQKLITRLEKDLVMY